jgi:protein-disulfide isomerase
LSAQDSITRQQADDILNELRQIRQLLERSPRADTAVQKPRQDESKRAKVSVTDRPFLGSRDAPITIVEFTDLQCPFCRQFHLSTFNDIKTNYIDPGKVRFYSKDLPLDFHANALNAAQAARCAGDPTRFWKLRDIMTVNASKLELSNILSWAQELNIPSESLQACIEGGKYKKDIQADIQEALRIGATGTPTFVIGRSTPEGVDGQVMVGAMSYAAFDTKFKELENLPAR